jgi:hypothetical protein
MSDDYEEIYTISEHDHWEHAHGDHGAHEHTAADEHADGEGHATTTTEAPSGGFLSSSTEAPTESGDDTPRRHLTTEAEKTELTTERKTKSNPLKFAPRRQLARDLVTGEIILDSEAESILGKPITTACMSYFGPAEW